MPFKRLIILWLNRLIKKNATINLACSKEAGAYVFKKRPFVVLNNGISLKQFNKLVGVAQDVEKMIPMNKIVIGNVARFVPLKNQKFLIDLAAFDKTKQNCCFFIFVGDGQTLDELKSKALENKLDNVLFLGERSDTNRIYGLFDIFCLPSLFEGLPLTVIEAQAYGLPCLVSLNVTTEADLHINDYLQINTNDVSDCYDTLLNLDIHKNILQENINNQFSYYMYDVQTVAGKLEDIYINAVKTDAKNENS